MKREGRTTKTTPPLPPAKRPLRRRPPAVRTPRRASSCQAAIASCPQPCTPGCSQSRCRPGLHRPPSRASSRPADPRARRDRRVGRWELPATASTNQDSSGHAFRRLRWKGGEGGGTPPAASMVPSRSHAGRCGSVWEEHVFHPCSLKLFMGRRHALDGQMFRSP